MVQDTQGVILFAFPRSFVHDSRVQRSSMRSSKNFQWTGTSKSMKLAQICGFQSRVPDNPHTQNSQWNEVIGVAMGSCFFQEKR